MVALSMLWLPILVSAVFVFIAANLLWMALPFWHRPDYKKLPDEAAVVVGLESAAPGQYVVPGMDWSQAAAEGKAAMQKGPGALMYVRNPNTFALGKSLTLYFIYCLIISALVGYVCHATLAAGAHYRHVFRIAGAVAILAYAFRGVPDSIWYGKPWVVTFKEFIDGVIYGLLTAGTFGWLWPH